MKKIETDVDAYFTKFGMTLQPHTRNKILGEVVVEFQKTGNIPAAIDTVVRNRALRARANKARAAGGGNPPAQASSGPPVAGAKKAPDGKWYVQTGKNSDGSPAYSRVENW